MQTLWTLAYALATALGQPGAAPADIAQAAGVDIRLAKENAHTRFYESTQALALQGGVVVGTLDIRQSRQHAHPLFVVLKDLGGTCITAEDLSAHLSGLTPPLPPSNPAPSAPITREAQLAGQRLGLAFKWSRPDCLASMAFHGH